MLPPFDDLGNLPPGIHPCDTDELVARFGSGSPEREIETQELGLYCMGSKIRYSSPDNQWELRHRKVGA